MAGYQPFVAVCCVSLIPFDNLHHLWMDTLESPFSDVCCVIAVSDSIALLIISTKVYVLVTTSIGIKPSII